MHSGLWRYPFHCPHTPGRVALVDGDGLAYTQAGPTGTSAGQAKTNLMSKLDAVRRATGADEVRILLTEKGSHKGHRYAVATVKPYQGQRSSGRRPDQWEYLRGVMEDSDAVGGCPVVRTNGAEADDLFAMYSHRLGYENVVIVTQDKDMRMVPGWHMTWDEHRMVCVEPGDDLVFLDKQYGMRWFWLQMLHGDTADNIPGLPKYINEKGKPALIGEVTARKVLAGVPLIDLFHRVFDLYHGWYKGDAPLHMLEQGILLWMRRKPSDVFDVCNPQYGPLAPILDAKLTKAIKERYDPEAQAE